MEKKSEIKSELVYKLVNKIVIRLRMKEKKMGTLCKERRQKRRDKGSATIRKRTSDTEI